jgi:hypothetical protein
MTVGNSGEDVHSIILDAGNDGVGVRDIVTNGRNRLHLWLSQVPSGSGESATVVTTTTERTFKT